jgi:hypothetical protein
MMDATIASAIVMRAGNVATTHVLVMLALKNLQKMDAIRANVLIVANGHARTTHVESVVQETPRQRQTAVVSARAQTIAPGHATPPHAAAVLQRKLMSAP